MLSRELASFAWGFLAASSLILGCLLTLWRPIGRRTLGMVMAFGGGVLVSAVAFELVQEAFNTSGRGRREQVAFGLFAGAADLLRRRSDHRPHGGRASATVGGRQAKGSALAIVLGIVLDGIPGSDRARYDPHRRGSGERGVLRRGRSRICPKRLPRRGSHTIWLDESPGSRTVDPRRARLGSRCTGRVHRLRLRLPGAIAFVLSFAGGAILTMLADTMMPEAFEHGGRLVGVVTMFGFALAFVVSALE